jgi:glycerol-3-phosphate acyltransferase PlsY
VSAAWLGTVLLALSYLLGSINVSYWVVRLLKGLDVRSVGSGNAGATNVVRAAGRRAGSVALLGDFAKGVAPVLLATGAGLGEPWPAAAALAVVLGHVFPVFLQFRGGKGVATAGGAFCALAPVAALAAAVVFAAVVIVARFVSLASICAAAVFPVALAFVSPRPTGATLACAGLTSALILWRHRGNVRRLWARAERRLGERS